MIEMFKDKAMQKSLAISAGIMTFLVFEIIGIIGGYPWTWLNILANILLLVFVVGFFTLILAFMIYDDIKGGD